VGPMAHTSAVSLPILCCQRMMLSSSLFPSNVGDSRLHQVTRLQTKIRLDRPASSFLFRDDGDATEAHTVVFNVSGASRKKRIGTTRSVLFFRVKGLLQIRIVSKNEIGPTENKIELVK
jgi:hypothetical protein